jgi:hypothetical protein
MMTRRFVQVAGIGFSISAGLGVVSILTNFGGNVLPAGVMAILYPALGPAARLLTGIWLIRESSSQ